MNECHPSLFGLLQPTKGEVGEVGEPVEAEVEVAQLVQPHQRQVLHLEDAVAGEVEPQEVDELLEDLGGQLLQLVVGEGEDLGGGLAAEGLPVEGAEAVVVEAEGAEGARVPHHDVLQLEQPVAGEVEVLQVGQAAEGLRLDGRQLVVLEVQLAEEGTLDGTPEEFGVN